MPRRVAPCGAVWSSVKQCAVWSREGGTSLCGREEREGVGEGINYIIIQCHLSYHFESDSRLQDDERTSTQTQTHHAQLLTTPCGAVCMEQCGAVWSSVEQCGAVWSSVEQCGAVWSSVEQCAAEGTCFCACRFAHDKHVRSCVYIL